jgi:hypothetical protein
LAITDLSDTNSIKKIKFKKSLDMESRVGINAKNGDSSGWKILGGELLYLLFHKIKSYECRTSG